MDLNVVCDYCGAKFHKSASKIKNTNFCSKECMNNYYKNGNASPKNTTCDYCGLLFHKSPKQIHDRNFCSRECYEKYKREMDIDNNVICDYCGKSFHKSKSQMFNINFCSNECLLKYREENRIGDTVKCEWCNKEFYISPSRKNAEHICCSKECAANLKKYLNKNYIICPVCNKQFHAPLSAINDGKVHCCSIQCMAEYRKTSMLGENNPNYGNKGSKNPIWKSDEKINSCGYKKIRCLDHPFKDCDGFVMEHRLIAEKYLLDDKNSIEIDGNRYLKPEYDVHHINKNKTDNRVENLMVLTRSEHMKLHAKQKYN